MATIDDPAVRKLLEDPNFAVISTYDADGSIHSTTVWIDVEDGTPAINSAVGRRWPGNLERDPRVVTVVYNSENPYEMVEIRGRATSTLDGAEEHIDRLAKKYLGVDSYPARQPGERRITFLITPERVRYAHP
jgi:PPOX class probable F420-dependent enzyme